MKYYAVSEDELRELIHDSMKLCALESGGVDNWDGYSEAIHEFVKDNDELYTCANQEVQTYEVIYES